MIPGGANIFEYGLRTSSCNRWVTGFRKDADFQVVLLIFIDYFFVVLLTQEAKDLVRNFLPIA